MIHMDCLNLLAVDINYVGPYENYDMEKESSKKVQQVWKYKVKTVKNALIQILIHQECLNLLALVINIVELLVSFPLM